MKIYTKTGDKGSTSLYDGVRVRKDDARVESYGTVDELGAIIGVAVNFIEDEQMIKELRSIQNRLFVVNENLATKDPEKIRHHITEGDIEVLEKYVDKYMEMAGPFKGFVINGTSKGAALLHYARTVCRRAERKILAFETESGEEVDPLVKQFINRLADTIFAYARACEVEQVPVNFEDELKFEE